jgi:hypothetical protein
VGSISGCDMAVLAHELRRGCDAMMESLCCEALPRLKGTTAECLIGELLANEQKWDLPSLAPMLADRRLLLVAAARDEALRAAGAQHLTTTLLDTDHCYADRRVALARTVLAWLQEVA